MLSIVNKRHCTCEMSTTLLNSDFYLIGYVVIIAFMLMCFILNLNTCYNGLSATRKRNKIKKLRQKGKTFEEISEILKIKVNRRQPFIKMCAGQEIIRNQPQLDITKSLNESTVSASSNKTNHPPKKNILGVICM